MIEIAKGNLLEAPVDALVNTVNTVGIMGKGIVLQFRQAYPEMFKNYEKACKAGDIQVGDSALVPWAVDWITQLCGSLQSVRRFADIAHGASSRDLLSTSSSTVQTQFLKFRPSVRDNQYCDPPSISTRPGPLDVLSAQPAVGYSADTMGDLVSAARQFQPASQLAGRIDHPRGGTAGLIALWRRGAAAKTLR